MKQMNPKWRDYPTANANTIDLANEKCVSWLCDSTKVWNGKYKTSDAKYAIGSPSVEMYMKAFNLWKIGNENANYLVCKVVTANGYSVGTKDKYDNFSGFSTLPYYIEEGPNNIFMTSGTNYWWLASPSGSYNDNICMVSGYNITIDYMDSSNQYIACCPVVSLNH